MASGAGGESEPLLVAGSATARQKYDGSSSPPSYYSYTTTTARTTTATTPSKFTTTTTTATNSTATSASGYPASRSFSNLPPDHTVLFPSSPYSLPHPLPNDDDDNMSTYFTEYPIISPDRSAGPSREEREMLVPGILHTSASTESIQSEGSRRQAQRLGLTHLTRHLAGRTRELAPISTGGTLVGVILPSVLALGFAFLKVVRWPQFFPMLLPLLYFTVLQSMFHILFYRYLCVMSRKWQVIVALVEVLTTLFGTRLCLFQSDLRVVFLSDQSMYLRETALTVISLFGTLAGFTIPVFLIRQQTRRPDRLVPAYQVEKQGLHGLEDEFRRIHLTEDEQPLEDASVPFSLFSSLDDSGLGRLLGRRKSREVSPQQPVAVPSAVGKAVMAAKAYQAYRRSSAPSPPPPPWRRSAQKREKKDLLPPKPSHKANKSWPTDNFPITYKKEAGKTQQYDNDNDNNNNNNNNNNKINKDTNIDDKSTGGTVASRIQKENESPSPSPSLRPRQRYGQKEQETGQGQEESHHLPHGLDDSFTDTGDDQDDNRRHSVDEMNWQFERTVAQVNDLHVGKTGRPSSQKLPMGLSGHRKKRLRRKLVRYCRLVVVADRLESSALYRRFRRSMWIIATIFSLLLCKHFCTFFSMAWDSRDRNATSSQKTLYLLTWNMGVTMFSCMGLSCASRADLERHGDVHGLTKSEFRIFNRAELCFSLYSCLYNVNLFHSVTSLQDFLTLQGISFLIAFVNYPLRLSGRFFRFLRRNDLLRNYVLWDTSAQNKEFICYHLYTVRIAQIGSYLSFLLLFGVLRFIAPFSQFEKFFYNFRSGQKETYQIVLNFVLLSGAMEAIQLLVLELSMGLYKRMSPTTVARRAFASDPELRWAFAVCSSFVMVDVYRSLMVAERFL